MGKSKDLAALGGGALNKNLTVADGTNAMHVEVRNGTNWTGRFAAPAVGTSAIQYFNGSNWANGVEVDASGRVGVGADPEETLHVRTYGNSEISTQYGTGLKAKLGAYANQTKVELPSASVPFEVSSETGAVDTLNLTSMYNGTKHYGLRMDDYGRLTTPRQPFFDGTIYNGGAQATGTVLTLSQYTNTGITLGNNNTRLTLPDEGYYFVTASQLAQPNSGMYAYFTVMVNGVTRYHAHNNFYSETNKDFVISKVMHLFGNDYIEFAWLHTNIVNSWSGAHSTVSVYKLG